VAQLILNKFDPLMNQYRQALGHIGSSSTENAPADVSRQICIIEGQLTWLTYIIGTVVGGHSWSSAHLGDGDETIDASLSRRALQLSQCVDYRLTQSNGAGRADPKLEQALLFYFQNFRRVYMFMWDQVRYLCLLLLKFLVLDGRKWIELKARICATHRMYDSHFDDSFWIGCKSQQCDKLGISCWYDGGEIGFWTVDEAKSLSEDV
jgi:hypothetical protein